MVFQSGALLNSLTVGENVGLYLAEHQLMPPEEIDRVVSEKLEVVGLKGRPEVRRDRHAYTFIPQPNRPVPLVQRWSSRSSALTHLSYRIGLRQHTYRWLDCLVHPPLRVPSIRW